MRLAQADTIGPLAALWGAALSPAALLESLLPTDTALGVPDTSDRGFWEGIDPASRDALVTEARDHLGEPWPTLLAGDYARYFLDGDREVYQDRVFARQRRTAAAVLAAAVTGEEAFLRESLDGLVLLCEQSSWCWPAHDDTRERHGAVLPTVTDPFLDLGAGEVVALVAWADAILGARLEATYPGLRGRLRQEADRRVFTPFLTRHDWWWLGIDRPPINWSPWIHGNVLTAALRLVDDAERRARIVAACLEGIDRYLAHLPADGAIDEGSAYWWEGAGRMLEALERVSVATQGALDASSLPLLRRVVGFPHRMQLGGDWFVNFADAPARTKPDHPWRTLFHWGRLTGEAGARALAVSHRLAGEPACPLSAGLARVVPALADPAWTRAARLPADTASLLPLDVWYPSVQVAVDRTRPGSSEGLTLAVKGGTNDESHNHNDVGSLIVAVDGRPVLIDVGQPTYTAQTFGPDRYSIWVTQSGWHTLPVIRGTEQSAGGAFSAGQVRRIDEGGRVGLTLDLAGAYPREDIETWQRTAVLDRTDQDRPTITLSDRWVFCAPTRTADAAGSSGGAGSATRFHVIVGGCVTADGNRLRIAAPAPVEDPAASPPAITVSWGDTPMDVQIEEQLMDDARLREVWGPAIRRVILVPRAAAGPTGRLDLTIGVEQ